MGHPLGVDSALAMRKRGFDSPMLHKIANRNWKATSGHERDTVEQSRVVTIEKVLVGTTCKGMPVRSRGSIPLWTT